MGRTLRLIVSYAQVPGTLESRGGGTGARGCLAMEVTAVARWAVLGADPRITLAMGIEPRANEVLRLAGAARRPGPTRLADNIAWDIIVAMDAGSGVGQKLAQLL